MTRVELLTGRLVVEGGKVSLQHDDGSMTELNASDRIEVFDAGKFVPVPYKRILDQSGVDKYGWSIYAGLHASVEKILTNSDRRMN
ncbi:hypothetical protein WJ0W_004572 [Paenibacillus melissococcoides]|uniref:Uncharacterized protein n=1 Tax=Paenibacillus melissococcoides TaxID=2912268 RepID=A0ABM9G6V0_9BACL|nr:MULTISPECIES: hypothetical protein [Paenibacillus]GIO83052.1 hypothetical protein J6TS7_66620 [Paenibacillus dendritiformis]CAH8247338.1 hypothetical protein WJ0W_004572 [Paenibacillus melissococcoides]CAH8717414.1 hypothetical protein HTL2_004939 [Paenibacillus melissococcoides]CAH8718401.1 hypothetical protein WDD9_005211 [Paenibacillus melissococcoides]